MHHSDGLMEAIYVTNRATEIVSIIIEQCNEIVSIIMEQFVIM
jgi:hypothetical protein